MSLPDETLARARQADILAVARRYVTLKRVNVSEWEGPCPVCAGKDRFSVNAKKRVWHCRRCDQGGNVISLVMHADGVSFAKAIETLTGEATEAKEPRRPDDRPPQDPLKAWRRASPLIVGTAVERYLASRGLILPQDASSLRFARDLWHWPTQTRWPAMLALVRRADGVPLTVHQTFLAIDGRGKAPIDKLRLFPAGVSPEGGGVWFGKADPDREFLVAEGVESLLAAMAIYGAAAGCAALSAVGVRGLALPPEVRSVRIVADHDRNGQGLIAAHAACRRWRAEGRAVVVALPDCIGDDMNDVLKRRRVL